MEEKILIKSEQYSVKKLAVVLVVLGILASAIWILWSSSSFAKQYDSYYNAYLRHQSLGTCQGDFSYYCYTDCVMCEIVQSTSRSTYITEHIEIWMFAPAVGLALISGLLYLWLRSYELTVTDKKIYGTVAWGKRVDLPMDLISATSTVGLLKGVSVSTSSGRISFLMLKNADDIYQVINEQLVERQQKKVVPAAVIQTTQTDEADKLRKYKDLLDSGVITQEEFEAKKRQLLDL